MDTSQVVCLFHFFLPKEVGFALSHLFLATILKARSQEIMNWNF